MSAIRQLVRYEIPGYILIVYSFLMLLPFLNVESILKDPAYFDLFGLIAAFFISGIPLGWFVFQIYDSLLRDYFGSKYAWKKPREILQAWDTEKKTCLQFRDRLMDFALEKSGLRELAAQSWSHSSARVEVGLLVPVLAPFLALIIHLLLSPFSIIDYAFFYTKILQSLAIWIFIFIFLLFLVFLKSIDVLKAVESYVVISLIERKDDIMILIKSELADRNWSSNA